MENKKLYLVTAKCGHVGLGKYIEITFPIKASNKREAADIVRMLGRVKHHHKDAIIVVNEVDPKTFYNKIDFNRKDAYLHSHSVQEQRINCHNIEGRILEDTCEVEENDPFERYRRIRFLFKKMMIMNRVEHRNAS